MIRLYVVKIEDHIQFLTKILQPAKCIDKEENVVWKLVNDKVLPHTSQQLSPASKEMC